MKKTIKVTIEEEISKRLQVIRKMLGYNTPKAFADELGLKYTTYLSYEKKRIPTSEVLFKIKQIFSHKVNIDWLLTGEGEPHDTPETKVADDPETSELIRITREIISQDTTYSQTLKANIRLAHEASERFRNLDGRVCALEELSADPKWLERRKAERRTQNDPDAIPGDVDRRSGTDRRRVAANK